MVYVWLLVAVYTQPAELEPSLPPPPALEGPRQIPFKVCAKWKILECIGDAAPRTLVYPLAIRLPGATTHGEIKSHKSIQLFSSYKCRAELQCLVVSVPCTDAEASDHSKGYVPLAVRHLFEC